jgi:hypothetical protein
MLQNKYPQKLYKIDLFFSHNIFSSSKATLFRLLSLLQITRLEKIDKKELACHK